MELEAHPDRFRWRLSSDGKFSARSTYDCFFFGREYFPCANKLWGSWAPLEIKIFVWLALHNRLWTADRLARRNLQHPPQCPLCCQEEETANHMLLQCSYSREVWYKVLPDRRLHRFTPQADSMLSEWWPSVNAAVTASNRKEFNALVCCVLRLTWLERNSRVFDKVAVLPSILTKRVKEEFAVWKEAR
uniref:Reverse transcriptase zinc-binding domain-containing protein n=1 Tax=Triticum urartu TaxID=4572 RepID=A0A8R7V761_TRIUA